MDVLDCGNFILFLYKFLRVVISTSRHEEGGEKRPAEEAKIVAPRARETHSAGRGLRAREIEGGGGRLRHVAESLGSGP